MGIDEQYLKQFPKEGLPIVFPVTLFQGPKKWTAALHFHDFLRVPEPLKPYVPFFEYHLVDLSGMSDDQIKGALFLRLFLMIMKHIDSPELSTLLATVIWPLFEKLFEEGSGLRYLKVMLSTDLAELYEVETRVLMQAVKRNIDRFPEDFMFQLNQKEFENLKSQIVISSWGGARRAKPYAFTEQGIAMLSSVLRSKRAVQVNIEIMRTFVKLREMLTSHQELSQRLNEMEQKYDAQFKVVFDVIRKFTVSSTKPKRQIGFGRKEKNGN